MLIKYTTKKNPKSKSGSKDIGLMIIFFALNFLAVPFSGYQTFMGYRDVAGGVPMAAILAGLSSLLFFGLNYIIMNLRKNGQPHLFQVFGYLLPLSLSFFGNFNAFYCNNTGATGVTIAVNDYHSEFDKTIADGKAALIASTGVEDRFSQKEVLFSDLKSQIRTGFGPNCENMWSDLQKIQSTSEVQDPNGLKSKCNSGLVWACNDYYKLLYRWFDGPYKTDSISRMNNVLTEVQKIDQLSKDIDQDLSAFKLIDPVKEGAKKISVGQQLIDKIKDARNDIGPRIQAKVADFHFIPSVPLPTQCTIGESVKQAMSGFMPTQTFLSVFFSLIIDLITLGFIFLAYSYNPRKRRVISGPRPR